MEDKIIIRRKHFDTDADFDADRLRVKNFDKFLVQLLFKQLCSDGRETFRDFVFISQDLVCDRYAAIPKHWKIFQQWIWGKEPKGSYKNKSQKEGSQSGGLMISRTQNLKT